MATLRSRAGKVICIGRNYVDHAKELGNATPSRPVYFLKPSSSILPPNRGPVLRPRGVELHYEVELAVIMGKNLGDVEGDNEEEAMAAIAGYAVGIDMTARNVQEVAKKNRLPWSEAKGFDTFLPLSNFIPKARIPDPHNVNLSLRVNGAQKQSDSTRLMIFRIPRLLSEVSKVMALEEGDVIMTGTPKGVGEVKAGDIMKAGLNVDGIEIEEGTIEVEVRDREGRYTFTET